MGMNGWRLSGEANHSRGAVPMLQLVGHDGVRARADHAVARDIRNRADDHVRTHRRRAAVAAVVRAGRRREVAEEDRGQAECRGAEEKLGVHRDPLKQVVRPFADEVAKTGGVPTRQM
jgi:hypothetical protein